MVVHIVLFKPRADLSDADRDALGSALGSALSKIALIRGFHVGRRVRHGAGYEASMPDDLEYAAVIEFDDLDALKAYLQHPVHQELGRRFMDAIAAAFVYDYEMEDGTGAGRLLEGSGVRPVDETGA